MNSLQEFFEADSTSIMLNGQDLPDSEIALKEDIDAMEEEYARLMRQYDSLLEQGKLKKAEELMETIAELEDKIAGAEADLKSNDD